MGLIIEYAANLYDAFISTWFVLKLCKGKIRESKFFFPCIILIFIISNVFTHLSDFSMWLTLIIMLILLGYAFTIRSVETLIKIISPVIYTVVLIVVNSMVVYVLSNFLSIPIVDLATKSFFGRYLHICLCKLVMTTVLVWITKLIAFDKKFSVFDLLIYLLFPAVTFINLYIFIKLGIEFDISNYSILIIFTVLALAIINVLTYMLFEKSVQNTTAKFELKLLESRRELEEERYRELGAVYSKLRVTRHDIREHLMYINCLMEEHKYEEVNKYISDKQSELEKTKRFYHTGNRMADFIIDSKVTQNEDIKFEISGTLDSLEGIDELDLTSLLGNILNNAIEGVASAPEKRIEVIFRKQGEYQNITCKNIIAESVLNKNPDLRSSKADKANHGFGIKSIKSIVEKYNGMVEFYEDGGMFCIHIALPVMDIK